MDDLLGAKDYLLKDILIQKVYMFHFPHNSVGDALGSGGPDICAATLVLLG
jgi:hypothetical protein